MVHQAALARLLSLLNRITGVALSSIASPDGALLGTAAGELEPDRLGGGSGQGAAAAAAAAAAAGGSASAFDDDVDVDVDVDVDDAAGETCGGENLAPKAQMITTACWLTMKEVSLTIAELARGVPVDDTTLLDPAALKACGEHLLHVLLSMKHNGAIEKTRVGLVCLGERLLRSSNPELSALPSDWLASLFNRLTSPEQGIKDLIRRSAGLPFGFTAVFLAEPAGVPRKLLHGAMARLLDIAVRVEPRRFFCFPDGGGGGGGCEFAAMNAVNSLTDSLPNELSGNLGNICSLYTKPEPRTDAPGRRPSPHPTLFFSVSLPFAFCGVAAAKTKPRLPLLTKP